MKRLLETAILTIAQGQSQASESIQISGDAAEVYCGAIARPKPEGLCRLDLKTNSLSIIDPLDINWFDGINGSFEERALSLPTRGGQIVDITALLSKPATEEITIEVAFLIIQNRSQC